MLQRLPIALAQVKAGKYIWILIKWNQILCIQQKILLKVHNNIINSISL